MARRLILDTGVLVRSERGVLPLDSLIAEDDDIVIAAITVAELRTGIELASSQHRLGRTNYLLRVLENIPVEAYDLAVAEAHGRLPAHVHRNGTPCGAHDLIIASTAVRTKRLILTTDRNARFDELPGVETVFFE